MWISQSTPQDARQCSHRQALFSGIANVAFTEKNICLLAPLKFPQQQKITKENNEPKHLYFMCPVSLIKCHRKLCQKYQTPIKCHRKLCQKCQTPIKYLTYIMHNITTYKLDI